MPRSISPHRNPWYRMSESQDTGPFRYPTTSGRNPIPRIPTNSYQIRQFFRWNLNVELLVLGRWNQTSNKSLVDDYLERICKNLCQFCDLTRFNAAFFNRKYGSTMFFLPKSQKLSYAHFILTRKRIKFR